MIHVGASLRQIFEASAPCMGKEKVVHFLPVQGRTHTKVRNFLEISTVTFGILPFDVITNVVKRTSYNNRAYFELAVTLGREFYFIH